MAAMANSPFTTLESELSRFRESPSESASSERGIRPGPDETVLLVDDQQAARETMAEQLDESRRRVLEVADCPAYGPTERRLYVSPLGVWPGKTVVRKPPACRQVRPASRDGGASIACADLPMAGAPRHSGILKSGLRSIRFVTPDIRTRE